MGMVYFSYVIFILPLPDSLLKLFLLQCVEWYIWATLMFGILTWVIHLAPAIVMVFVSFHTTAGII